MSTGSAILRPGTIAVPQVFEAIVQRCIDDGDLQCEHVRKAEIWHLIGSEKRPLTLIGPRICPLCLPSQCPPNSSQTKVRSVDIYPGDSRIHQNPRVSQLSAACVMVPTETTCCVSSTP